jgi:hypothetical protein
MRQMPGKPPRNHPIQSFLTDEEFERFNAVRTRQDRTVASFIRVALLEAIRREEVQQLDPACAGK